MHVDILRADLERMVKHFDFDLTCDVIGDPEVNIFLCFAR